MMKYKESYTPVDPDYYEIIDRLTEHHRSGKVFYFNPENGLEEGSGSIIEVSKEKDGEFLRLTDQHSIRLDKVITIFGKPGPAYDEYDRYANTCLTCEDLGQF